MIITLQTSVIGIANFVGIYSCLAIMLYVVVIKQKEDRPPKGKEKK